MAYHKLYATRSFKLLKIVEKLAKGQVNTEKLVLAVTPQIVDIELVESQSVSGELIIETMTGDDVRGVIYTSDPRMELSSNQFSGVRNVIKYEYHGDYMLEGDTANGFFYITSQCGETKVPFSVVTKRLYAQASVGKIDTMGQFIKLYKASMKEALLVYCAPAFYKLLESESEKQYYRLLSVRPITLGNVEEFLIATQRKHRVSLSIDDTGRIYRGLDVILTDSVTISMSGWGYTEVFVTSDNDFVTPVRDRYTAEDFIAGSCRIEYKINPAKLHRGKCIANLRIESTDQVFNFEITCMPNLGHTEEFRYHQRVSRENVALLGSYVRFLAGEKSLGQWASETNRLIEQRYIRSEASRLDMLWSAYAYRRNGQIEKSVEILEDFRKSYDNRDNRQWALYTLCLLLDELDENRVSKLVSQIRDLYIANPKDKWYRFIMLLAIEAVKEDSKNVYQLLAGWYKEGVHSPVLYAHASKIFLEEPYVLGSLGDFELQILNWMMKKSIISKDLADQIGHISLSSNGYNALTDRLLSYCYETYHELDVLASVCSYRIKGEIYNEESIEWYEMAIKHDLKITGLYEAYINSINPNKRVEIPESVLIYFQYSNLLSYSRKALLYANVVKNREKYPEVYNRYFPIMVSFAENEMAANHIDDSLAVVYEHILSNVEFNERMAENLSEILYTNKLVCPDEGYESVVIQHENLAKAIEYPIVDGKAFFPVYFGNYVLLLKDKNGRLVFGSPDCQLMRLFNPGRYIRTCLELAPGKLSYIMHHMSGKVGLYEMDEQMAYYARALVDSDIINDDYKSKVGPGVLEYLRRNEPIVNTRNYLLKIDYSKLGRTERKDYLETLVGLAMYEEAWSFLIQYGAGDLGIEHLLKIVVNRLDDKNVSEDEELVYFSQICFDAGIKDKRIIKYLMKYYIADAKHMARVFKAGRDVGIKSVEYDERVLILMAFSRTFVKYTEEIFIDYCNVSPREFIRRAYLNYFSYRAYVSGEKMSEEFYHILERSIIDGFKLCDYCKLAMIKYYCNLDTISSNRMQLMDDMVTYFLSKGMYYDVFTELPQRLLIRHHLYDVVVVSYRSGKKNSEIFANYRFSEKEPFVQERIEETKDGVYTFKKRLAPLEKIEVYFTETSDRMRLATSPKYYAASGVGEDVDNYYNALVRMNSLNRYTESIALQEEAMNYHAKKQVAEKVFKLF